MERIWQEKRNDTTDKRNKEKKMVKRVKTDRERRNGFNLIVGG